MSWRSIRARQGRPSLSLTVRTRSRQAPMLNSRNTIRSRGGWNTMRGRSGRSGSASSPRLANARMSDLHGIGITNQRETVVVWDRTTGEPVSRAIVWQDRRTADFCDELRARSGLEETIAARPASWSTPTSPARRSNGCWITSPDYDGALTGMRSPSARWIPGWSGTSPAASSTSPIIRMRPERCFTTSRSFSGISSFLISSRYHGRSCPRSSRPAMSSAGPIRAYFRAPHLSRSPGSPATSKRLCSARPATVQAWPRTPTAPAPSCWRTPAPASCAAGKGC
jgi:FGGY family of carbohydrate kinases, N-terminal domain